MYLINNSKIPDQCNKIKKLFNQWSQCELSVEENSMYLIYLILNIFENLHLYNT